MGKQKVKLSAAIIIFILAAMIFGASGCSPDPMVVYAKKIEEVSVSEFFINMEIEMQSFDDYLNQLSKQDMDTVTDEEILTAKERLRAVENEIAEMKSMVEKIDIEDEKVREVNSYLIDSIHYLSLLLGEIQTLLDLINEMNELIAEAKDPDSGLEIATYSLKIETLGVELNECIANGDRYVVQADEMFDKWETALIEALGQ
jgi:hypothetical protein